MRKNKIILSGIILMIAIMLSSGTSGCDSSIIHESVDAQWLNSQTTGK